jgi:hypothetical protein
VLQKKVAFLKATSTDMKASWPPGLLGFSGKFSVKGLNPVIFLKRKTDRRGETRLAGFVTGI